MLYAAQPSLLLVDTVVIAIIECLHWLFMIEYDHHGNEPMLELHTDAVAFQIFYFYYIQAQRPHPYIHWCQLGILVASYECF